MRAFPTMRASVVAHGANPCAPHVSQPRTNTKTALAISLIRTRGKRVKASAYDAAPWTRHQGGRPARASDHCRPCTGGSHASTRRETGGKGVSRSIAPTLGGWVGIPRNPTVLVRSLGILNTGTWFRCKHPALRLAAKARVFTGRNNARSGPWRRDGRDESEGEDCRGETGLSGLDRHGVENQPLRPGNAGPVARTGSASPSLHRHAGKR